MTTPQTIAELCEAGPARVTARTLSLADRIQERWWWRGCTTLTAVADRLADQMTDDRSGAPTVPAWQALLRAGLLVRWCQGPSTLRPGDMLDKRSAVCGFADGYTVDWLGELLLDTGYELLVFETYDPKGQDYRRVGVPVEHNSNGNAFKSAGTQLDAEQIRVLYPLVPWRARKEITRSWQVTIYDPVWGRTGMFDLLYRAATAHIAEELS